MSKVSTRSMRVFAAVVLLTGAMLGTKNASSQSYQQEMAAFRSQDSATGMLKGRILFIGSSSFTIWKDVQDYFPDQPILNRAFGGSTLADQVEHVAEVVYPYDPKQIVMYCGENDVAYADSITPRIVLRRFKAEYGLIRKQYPGVPFVYVSIKPSPSRALLQDRMVASNALIRKFLKGKKNTAYVDVYSEMLDDEGKPRPELFGDDMLHMNKEGYKIWQRILAPYLIK